MRKFIILFLCLLMAASVTAQGTTPTTTPSTTTTTANTSSVNIFYIACDTQGVISFDGTMEAGFDIYYQLFSGAGGTGQALTALRRVTVNGAYAVSDQQSYNSGQTVPAGSTGSARVTIARETNSSSTIFDSTVNDLQDGCNSPRNALASSTAADAPVTTTATGIIRSPFGDFLNIDQPVNPIVVIGVPLTPGRANRPGEIFAECDQYLPEASPGVLYDTDNIVIFWSWFARAPEQAQDHIDKAIYDVTFQTAPLINVQVSPIEKRGTNHWVFYSSQIGHLSPGTYGVNFKLSWEEQTDDGYDIYGPDTDNDFFNSTCTFEIKRNPFGGTVDYNNIYSLNVGK